MLKFYKHSTVLSLALLSFAWVCGAHADEADVRKHMLELVNDDKDARKEAIGALTKSGDSRLIPFFKDFVDKKIFLWKGQLVQCADVDAQADLLDPLTRAPLPGNPKATAAVKAEMKALEPNGRGELNRFESARSLLGLYSSDSTIRRESVVTCAANEIESTLPTLVDLLKTEPVSRVRFALEESIARLQLLHANGKAWTPEQMDAVRKLGELCSARGISR